jgi:hypothetical protein
MINEFEKFVLRRLIPQSYHDSSDQVIEGGKRLDWYAVYLKTGTDNWLLHVKAMNDREFVGNSWNKTDQGFTGPEDCISFSTDGVSIEIVRQIDGRLFPLTYHTVYECVFYDWTRINRLPIMLGRIDQFFFNHRKIALPELTRVLRVLVEKRLEGSNLKITEVNLPKLVYGRKWVLHPDRNKLQKQAQFKLESLLFSGELKREENHYELSGKALATLEKYECESRRHTQIISLTAALVVVGLVQVCVAWFASTPRDMNDDILGTVSN